MFDFIPVEYYTAIQYHCILGILMVIFLESLQYPRGNSNSLSNWSVIGVIFMVVFILYMGQRQISGRYFGDTANYNRTYQLLQQGHEIIIHKDLFFNYFMEWCSKIMSIRSFFVFIDILYVLPCYLFAKKYFKKYWFYAFLIFISSFSFWGSGTNGLRNGLGTSFFILGLYFYNRKLWMYLCFILGYLMHASIMIPIVAFIVSGMYKHPKMYLYIWIAAIPLSLAGGSAWTSFFANLGFAEDRTAGYLVDSESNLEQFAQTGFRWDFLMYSGSAVFAGWYFIFKKKITDPFYIHLFGIYCIANAFWILVITAAFSNRFAYLSWFLMPMVIAYPMFRYKIWENQYRIFAIILLAYFAFTYLMNVIL